MSKKGETINMGKYSMLSFKDASYIQQIGRHIFKFIILGITFMIKADTYQNAMAFDVVIPLLGTLPKELFEMIILLLGTYLRNCSKCLSCYVPKM